MTKPTRLELTWVGKTDPRPRLEPRILLEDPARSHHAPHRVSDSDIFDNRLIHGDNLLALKALEADLAGKVKCVFIDPPYNTGSAFTHYDDGLEHSLWLTMMRDRLELLRRLLADDGSLWITIDDHEVHYLKVLCDEMFGRDAFIANIIWEKADSPRNSARYFSTDHDHVLAFAKNMEVWRPRKLARTDASDAIYSNPDDDPRGAWLPGDPYANKPYSKGQYTKIGPTGRTFQPPPGRFWRVSEEKFKELEEDGRIWWGPNRSARPSIKRYLAEVSDLVPRTMWSKDEVGSNRTSKNEMRALFPNDPFDTPKPEALMKRILDIATNPGDLVLDSFAGSGTTGAVAHKMGRRWVMVELGDHAHTHILPRLTKVVDGEDPGGVTEAVGWRGGGGFRFERLAPSLLSQDRHGRLVVNPAYNPEMLSEAVCKLEGFAYDPSPDTYWLHGRSTERDFLYVTTTTLSPDQLAQLSDEVGPNRTLLVACAAFRQRAGGYPNLTLKKIPTAVLSRCEWGRDDYSLQIATLPPSNPVADPAFSDDDPPSPRGRGAGGEGPRRLAPAGQTSLFEGDA